ncbi:MAG: hypothetical protein LBE09_02550 [Christensenellaceae bacterium]|jgi:hypothetical protein|nr:hypothetical protein [Christensenellaceae bacterium]
MKIDIRNNRLIALIFRAASVVLCLAGLLDITGAFGGTFSPNMLLFYTNQSNILVLVMFIMLLVKTVQDVAKNGINGSASYFERLSAIVMLAISVTMLVFWLMLAPTIGGSVMGGANYLWTFSNLQLHLITPLLMIVDFFVFAKPGKYKKADIHFFACVPLAYLVQATILGFSGVVYMVRDGQNIYFPYFFMDYYNTKGWVALYLVILVIFFLGLATAFYFLDKKRGIKANAKESKTETDKT